MRNSAYISTNRKKKLKKRKRIAAYIIKRRIAQHAPRTTWEDKEGEWNNGGVRVKKAETVVIGEEVEELGFFDRGRRCEALYTVLVAAALH